MVLADAALSLFGGSRVVPRLAQETGFMWSPERGIGMAHWMTMSLFISPSPLAGGPNGMTRSVMLSTGPVCLQAEATRSNVVLRAQVGRRGVVELLGRPGV